MTLDELGFKMNTLLLKRKKEKKRKKKMNEKDTVKGNSRAVAHVVKR